MKNDHSSKAEQPSATMDAAFLDRVEPGADEVPQEVCCLLFNCATGTMLGTVKLEEAKAQLEHNKEHFIWIYLIKPKPEVLSRLQQDFDLHDLAIEDTTLVLQRTKIETYDNNLFVVFSTVNRLEGAENIEFGSTNIFLGERFIISIRQGNTLCEQEVREICKSNPAQVALGPSYIFYALMSCLVEQYLPILEQMHERLQALKENIFSDRFHRQTLHYLYHLKEELTRFHLAVAPTQEVVRYLIVHHGAELADLVPKQVIPYFRDIQDKLLTTLDVIQSQSEMQKAAMETHLAQVSLSQNEIVKRLASWAAILAVPTLIASIYGMNFDLMPELHWPASYFIILIIMITVCSFLFYRFRQVNWL
ncbi:magnesium/cobalt transporter CorA [Alkanindiges sp. WGS2144]|uniref:magnesium/cobalt transporter CorA n=1 Tax=Alkanindiges sp. WGS2144 TaxID=3366808 RepID=UPI003751C878